MSSTYYKFLFATTVKRKSIWITLALYVFVAIAFLVIVPLSIKMNPLQLWANTATLICQSFMGIMIAIFTSILAINIFKISHEEGTELVVVSKPIARPKVIFTKFMVFFTYCLIANMAAVIVSIFTVFLPTTEMKFYWGLILSMFIGNLIVFSLYGAIAILLSVKVAKVGIIVTNAIISVVLFSYQVMSIFVFSNTIANLTEMDKSGTSYQSYVLPVRNTETGEYTEKNFVGFLSTVGSDGTYDMKATDFKGVKDYWEKRNSKTNSKVVIGTDIASQLAYTYLTANINGYADRNGKRIYNMSSNYKYELTGPVSDEFYENTDNGFTSIYTGMKSWYEFEYLGQKIKIYLPNSYVYQAMRSTKSSFLKGTATDKIPIADIKGKSFFELTDVFFEPDEWQAYKPYFDIMYDNIFRYDIKNGKGENYYQYSDNLLSERSKNFEINSLWCCDGTQIKRFYQLVWACLTGHHSDEQYFGDATPLKGVTAKTFNINNALDLNKRFIQFKYYCYFKIYKEQKDLMLNGLDPASDEYKIEQTSYTANKSLIEAFAPQVGLTQNGEGIGQNGFTIRCPKDTEVGIDDLVLEPGTQTLNATLLKLVQSGAASYLKNTLSKTPLDKEWLQHAEKGSWATYYKTIVIANYFVYQNEEYLFDSVETPERNNNWSCQMYMTDKKWYPYAYNVAAAKQGVYFPYGQNLELSYFKSTNRIQYYVFTIIWGCISLAGLAAGVLVYNKFDVK